MISVIIPAFDNASYILESIASARRQFPDYGDLEIIVVDDGSTDNTKELVVSAMENDSAIRFFRQNHLYAAAARNRGISEARGEWVYLLDADDVSSEEALPALYDAALSSGADAVFALTRDFISPELSEAQKAALCPRSEAYPGILPGASLIRRTVFDKVGLFDVSLSSGETVDWLVRFRNSGLQSVNIPFIALHRRLHLRNTGRVRKAAEAADYARIIRKRMLEKR